MTPLQLETLRLAALVAVALIIYALGYAAILSNGMTAPAGSTIRTNPAPRGRHLMPGTARRIRTFGGAHRAY